MRSRWSAEEAAAFAATAGCGEDLALRTHTSRLLGADGALVLHGGGNTSVKRTLADALGEPVEAVCVKASGQDLASIAPEGHVPLDRRRLLRLLALETLSDARLADEMRLCLLDARAPGPSIEALVHAVVPARYVDHTHADAILALTNRVGGEALAREALGDAAIVLPYVEPGFALARAVQAALEAHPEARALVLAHHGLLTWGETAEASYEATIALADRAERFLHARAGAVAVPQDGEDLRETLPGMAERLLPVLRGLTAVRTGDPDRPWRPFVLRLCADPEILRILALPHARALVESPPVTTDHLIRTKASFLWADLGFADGSGRTGERDAEALRAGLAPLVAGYADAWSARLERNRALLPEGVLSSDPMPRVVAIPGLGLVCAGIDEKAARVAADIAVRTLRTKALVAATGEYRGLSEAHLFAMEVRPLQRAKLARAPLTLEGRVALVTGAAGAIGAGICDALLADGCHVAATDLAGDRLHALVRELGEAHGGRILAVEMDVTDAASVEAGFARVVREWGGVDLVVPNAGVALVQGLEEMDLDAYRRVQRVNEEGTLLVLREAARQLRAQGIGGDIVVVSTKNVFAPGARFGAYSATKAAAHQLARIASLELAPVDVRVNMVAPDAVFSHGAHRSGLWAEVGPDRMKARGLDEAGLEAYYRSRNLLKARVTAVHVANAVRFFATRQTPTTGATIPVDGGLPDATPR